MKRWQDVQHSIRNCLTCRSGITVSSIWHRLEPMSMGKAVNGAEELMEPVQTQAGAKRGPYHEP